MSAKRRDGESLDDFLQRMADAAPPEIRAAYFGGKAAQGEAIAFIEKAVAYQGDDCLIWPYSVKNGYGNVWYEGRIWRAHRLVLTLVQGPPPDDKMDAAHAPVVCHKRRCVNPAHLRWATSQENNADKKADGTLRRGEQVAHKARLTAAQVLAIRESYQGGRRIADLVRDYGVGQTTIRAIIERRSWKHI